MRGCKCLNISWNIVRFKGCRQYSRLPPSLLLLSPYICCTLPYFFSLYCGGGGRFFPPHPFPSLIISIKPLHHHPIFYRHSLQSSFLSLSIYPHLTCDMLFSPQTNPINPSKKGSLLSHNILMTTWPMR